MKHTELLLEVSHVGVFVFALVGEEAMHGGLRVDPVDEDDGGGGVERADLLRALDVVSLDPGQASGDVDSGGVTSGRWELSDEGALGFGLSSGPGDVGEDLGYEKGEVEGEARAPVGGVVAEKIGGPAIALGGDRVALRVCFGEDKVDGEDEAVHVEVVIVDEDVLCFPWRACVLKIGLAGGGGGVKSDSLVSGESGDGELGRLLRATGERPGVVSDVAAALVIWVNVREEGDLGVGGGSSEGALNEGSVLLTIGDSRLDEADGGLGENGAEDGPGVAFLPKRGRDAAEVCGVP